MLSSSHLMCKSYLLPYSLIMGCRRTVSIFFE
jgi:hypothetical protein